MLAPLKATGCPPQEFDEPELLRALELLTDPAHGTELRFAPSFRSSVRPAADILGLLADVHDNADATAVYFCINPVSPFLVGAAKNDDVLSRRWFFLDFDPVRPKDCCATDVEKALARERTRFVAAWLHGRSWPDPIVVDSGNGMHLYYRVDLPNDELTRALFRGLVRGLATRFDNEVVLVDRSVHKAAQVAKLPGTWARKGANDPDRPWRRCRIDAAPDELMTLEPSVLQETLAELTGTETPKAKPRPRWGGRPFGVLVATSGRSERAYGDAALKGETEAVASESVHGHNRNTRLYTAALKVGTFLHWGHWTRAEIEQRLEDAAVRCQLHLDEGGMAGVQATIRSGLEYGLAHPRADLEPVPAAERTTPRAKARPSANGAPPPGGEDPVIYRASTVTPRKVEWLWPGRIPLAKLTTFAGMGGLGKTFSLCDIAARITTGKEWPDGSGACPDVGDALIISGEDDPEDTLVPRLIECGADLERVAFLRFDVLAGFCLSQLEVLEKAADQMGGRLRFVAIDPPTSYLGDVNDHKNAELRALLSPLALWASRRRLAVVFNTHVNKQVSQVEAALRVMGSVAWINSVRAAHLFCEDPDDGERSLFLPIKNNLGKKCAGLAYKILPLDNGEARVQWLGEVEMTANQALRQQPKRQRRDLVARDWLIEKFREHRVWKSDDLFQAADQEGVSRNAVFEAKRILDLPRARRNVLENGAIVYTWWVPDDWPLLSQQSSQQPGHRDTGTVEEQDPFP